MADETDGYHVRDDEAALEATRLAHLAATRDPHTFELLTRTGITDGWHCLELGAGAGTVARWMADRVGTEGRVMSTDIDLQFHAEATPNMIVRRHDIRTDPLPRAHFDLVHARAVLQHIPEREQVIDTLIDTCKPGGWLVLEDGDFAAFAAQALPAAYQPLHDLICAGTTTSWRDGSIAVRLLGALRDRGCTDLDVVGDVWAMRPGESGGEWWFLALERAAPRLVEAGLLTTDQVDAALAAVRAPDFVMMSTLSIAVLGRTPT
jgi:SAM-dependent methyltransferase